MRKILRQFVIINLMEYERNNGKLPPFFYRFEFGLNPYDLVGGPKTEELLSGIVERVEDLFSGPEEKFNGRLYPCVARATLAKLSAGWCIPRVIWGGRHELADTVKSCSCIDAAVLFAAVLNRINTAENPVIKRSSFGFIPDHHYVVLDSGEVFDPYMGTKGNYGLFASEEELLERQARIAGMNLGGIGWLLAKNKLLGLAQMD